jgi:hypothetical protein
VRDKALSVDVDVKGMSTIELGYPLALANDMEVLS